MYSTHPTNLQKVYSQRLQELSNACNEHVKWNFVITYLLKQSMEAIEDKQFEEWVRSDTPFSEMKIISDFEDGMQPPPLPPRAAEALAKVRNVASRIFRSPLNVFRQQVGDQFRQQAAQITSYDLQIDEKAIVTHLLDLTKQANKETFKLSLQDDRDEFVNQFLAIFSHRGNQTLSDEEILGKVNQMFTILKENSAISPGQFAEGLSSIWKFPQEHCREILVDISSFWVRHNPYSHNPYNRPVAEIISEIHSRRRPFIHRVAGKPFSLEIDHMNQQEVKDKMLPPGFFNPYGQPCCLVLEEETDTGVKRTAFNYVCRVTPANRVRVGPSIRVHGIKAARRKKMESEISKI